MKPRNATSRKTPALGPHFYVHSRANASFTVAKVSDPAGRRSQSPGYGFGGCGSGGRVTRLTEFAVLLKRSSNSLHP